MIVSREVGDIISEIKMLVSDDPGAMFWLLEGVTDIRFFKPRLISKIELIDCEGKYKLLDAMRAINDSSAMSKIPILGIVDNDYDWLTGFELPENIISTEPRDLEGILLRANCVSAVLAEFGARDAIDAFESKEGSVVDAIRDRALVFGKIRAWNGLNRRVCLKELKPIQFFGPGWTYNQNRIVERAVKLLVARDAATLLKGIEELPNVEPWHYIRGHDAVDILCGGLLSVLGGRPGLTGAHIEPVLRQSYSYAQYKKTAMHGESERWHSDKSLPYPYKTDE